MTPIGNGLLIHHRDGRLGQLHFKGYSTHNEVNNRV